MSFTNKRLIRVVAAVIGLFAMAMIASRQLYLFSVFRDASGILDRQGGVHHLWLAIGAALIACIAGGLMSYFMLLRGGKEDVLKVN
jgi:membrane protein YqaA with SNARE-associated domain